MAPKDRQIKNLLISPKSQFSLVARVLTAVVVSMAVFIVAALVPLWHFVDILRSMLGPGDPAKESLLELVDYYFFGVALLAVVVLVAVAVWGVYYSHRIFGAQYAINRYIKEQLLPGNFNARLGLRHYDFLTETAENLNLLAAKLNESK